MISGQLKLFQQKQTVIALPLDAYATLIAKMYRGKQARQETGQRMQDAIDEAEVDAYNRRKVEQAQANLVKFTPAYPPSYYRGAAAFIQKRARENGILAPRAEPPTPVRPQFKPSLPGSRLRVAISAIVAIQALHRGNGARKSRELTEIAQRLSKRRASLAESEQWLTESRLSIAFSNSPTGSRNSSRASCSPDMPGSSPQPPAGVSPEAAHDMPRKGGRRRASPRERYAPSSSADESEAGSPQGGARDRERGGGGGGGAVGLPTPAAITPTAVEPLAFDGNHSDAGSRDRFDGVPMTAAAPVPSAAMLQVATRTAQQQLEAEERFMLADLSGDGFVDEQELLSLFDQLLRARSTASDERILATYLKRFRTEPSTPLNLDFDAFAGVYNSFLAAQASGELQAMLEASS